MFFSHSLLVVSSSLLERSETFSLRFKFGLSSLCLVDHIRPGFQCTLCVFNIFNDFSFFYQFVESASTQLVLV